MITIIDENNLVTEDGVELVAKNILSTNTSFYYCNECYFYGRDFQECKQAPCEASDRKIGRSVIFVEKNPC